MIEKLQSSKLVVFIVEIAVTLVLLFVLVSRMKGNSVTTFDLSSMSTGHDEVKFDGTSWCIDADAAAGLVGNGTMIYGPNVALERGTYTLVLNYNTTSIQKGVVEVDSGLIDTADYFVLSNNKNEVRYDFILKTDVDGFKFRLKEYRGGYFKLNAISIIRNTHDIRIFIFIWVVFSVLLNILLYSEIAKKNTNGIAIVLGIALLASLPLFPRGIMTGNDIRFHLARIEALVAGLKSWEIPVKMYSVFNDGYGYPIGIYYGDVLLYIPAVLRLIGFTTLQSYKLYIFLTNTIAAGIAYYCGKRLFSKGEIAALFSLIYTVGTYRLLCVYTRAAVGEYTASCFYPLIILAVWRIYTEDIKSQKYKKNAVLLAIGMSGLIYSHILSTEMFIIALAIIAIVLYKKTFKTQTMMVYLSAVVISTLISAAFIVPFMEYYTRVDTMLDDSSFKSTYIQASGAFISDYFAVFKSLNGGDFPIRRALHTPGLVLMISLGLGVYLLVKKQANHKIKFATIGAIICLFVSSNCFPWNRVYEIPKIGPVLVSVQFPYRYLGVGMCFLSVLMGLGLERLIEKDGSNRKFVHYTVLLSIIMTLVFLSQYQDEQYVSSILRTYDTADLLTYTRSGEFGMYIGSEYLLEDTVLSAEAFDYGVYGENVQVVIVSEEGLNMDVHVEAGENATLEVPRFAYPHFKAKDDAGNELPVICGNNNKLTVLFTQPYSGEVYIDFEEPWYWRLSELISLFSIAVVVLWIYINKKNSSEGNNQYE